jgi:hypothetical protein
MYCAGQDFLRGDGGDRTLAEREVDEGQQPAEFFHRYGRAAFALRLHKPFVGDSIEAIGRSHRSGNAI